MPRIFQNQLSSWGRLNQSSHTAVLADNQNDLIDWMNSQNSRDQLLLTYGLGRSYGDSCLNTNQTLIYTSCLDKLVHFEAKTGQLTAMAGVSLGEILNFSIPKGWFLPVSPGTKYVSLGGAIANDVHGKNHHKRSSFGNHLISLKLLRSSGEYLDCSPSQNTDLFHATVGGLGLTGTILEACLQLIPIESAYIDQEILKFETLDEFFEISDSSDLSYEYTVAWIDCIEPKKQRGLFIRGNHAISPQTTSLKRQRKLSIPVEAPSWLINPLSVKGFNWLYYNKQQSAVEQSKTYFEPFFYPLDAVLGWNKLYGSGGFFQYQFLVPTREKQALQEALRLIQKSKLASPLAVLKKFGDQKSRGILSFPTSGYTLALDFCNRNERTLKLFHELDALVLDAKGRVYPAKDSVMSKKVFENSFSQLEDFIKHVDPKYSSDLWRRLRL